MIKLRIEKAEKYADIRFPCNENVITDTLKRPSASFSPVADVAFALSTAT